MADEPYFFAFRQHRYCGVAWGETSLKWKRRSPLPLMARRLRSFSNRLSMLSAHTNKFLSLDATGFYWIVLLNHLLCLTCMLDDAHFIGVSLKTWTSIEADENSTPELSLTGRLLGISLSHSNNCATTASGVGFSSYSLVTIWLILNLKNNHKL